tara:strand:- start:648 stop:1028 length:381 start_codon:yes stop_codon:yes gene_type:complete
MSTILVNTLTGTSTAGSIAVTGEGNSTTTNLQQGLAKVWVFGTDNVITDSLNTSSSTDVGTGEYTFTLTSATATTNVAMSACVNENDNLIVGRKSNTTSSYNIRIKNTSNTGTDANTGSSVHGDLA